MAKTLRSKSKTKIAYRSSPTSDVQKEKTLTIRIDSQTLQIMDIYNEKIGLGKSELVRRAVHQYMLMHWLNEKRPHPKLIFAWNMFRPLMDLADEDTIKQVAEISYLNGKMNHEMYDQYKELFLASVDTTTPDFWLESLVNWVFAEHSQNWFQDAQFYTEGENYYFSGKHQLGANFSLFIRLLLEKYLAEVEYEVVEEKSRQLITEISENDDLFSKNESFVMLLRIQRSSNKK